MQKTRIWNLQISPAIFREQLYIIKCAWFDFHVRFFIWREIA